MFNSIMLNSHYIITKIFGFTINPTARKFFYSVRLFSSLYYTIILYPFIFACTTNMIRDLDNIRNLIYLASSQEICRWI